MTLTAPASVMVPTSSETTPIGLVRLDSIAVDARSGLGPELIARSGEGVEAVRPAVDHDEEAGDAAAADGLPGSADREVLISVLVVVGCRQVPPEPAVGLGF